jgi:hypothetical protein
MSFTIWKAVLDLTDVQDIEVPADAELLTAREQYGSICVWFKCDPSRPMTKRRVAICGTGHPAPEGARYVGTGFLSGGALVLHVFERVSSSPQDTIGASND